MTLDKAIQLIDEIASSYYPCDKKDALEMAIKALEPCEDTISRGDALKALDYDIKSFEFKSGVGKHMNEIANLLNTIYEIQVNNIKALPSVIPQEAKTGHWIPVSERLPKDDKDVLVCDSQGAMEVCYYHVDDNVYPTEFADLNETGWYNEHDDVLYFEPIAWMPLSEPYEPQESEEV